MKMLTLTKKDIAALDAYFDEGPPLEGAIAKFFDKVERLKDEDSPSKRSKLILAFADLLDDEPELEAYLTKRVGDGVALSNVLRVHVDMSTACD